MEKLYATSVDCLRSVLFPMYPEYFSRSTSRQKSCDAGRIHQQH